MEQLHAKLNSQFPGAMHNSGLQDAVHGGYDNNEDRVNTIGGNNPYGSQGTLKCKLCRDRRKKVFEFLRFELTR
jgi:hypothetical protein